MLYYVLAVAVTLLIAVPVSVAVTSAYRKKVVEQKIGSAEAKAREIIDEAVKTAEEKKREGLLEIKEESVKAKSDLDKEIKERRAEVQRSERRIQQKFADTFGNFRAARFTQLHHRITFAGEHFNQLVDLRRLSGTVDSF